MTGGDRGRRGSSTAVANALKAACARIRRRSADTCGEVVGIGPGPGNQRLAGVVRSNWGGCKLRHGPGARTTGAQRSLRGLVVGIGAVVA